MNCNRVRRPTVLVLNSLECHAVSGTKAASKVCSPGRAYGVSQVIWHLKGTNGGNFLAGA